MAEADPPTCPPPAGSWANPLSLVQTYKVSTLQFQNKLYLKLDDTKAVLPRYETEVNRIK